MPKLFKLLRSQKRRSSLAPSTPLGGKAKKGGIFRSTPFGKKSSKKTAAEPPVIEAAITYSLSEDEESCDLYLSSDIDIENQVSALDSPAEAFMDNFAFVEKATNLVETKEIADVETSNSVESKTNGSSEIEKENDETMTFTHLEIMRNELAHMMQIANKDKEIYQLQKDTEEMKIQHAEILASKDAEIARIKTALTEVESSLVLAQNKLASEETEHSKTIEILMQTQYEYHELNNKSWLQPLFCYF